MGCRSAVARNAALTNSVPQRSDKHVSKLSRQRELKDRKWSCLRAKCWDTIHQTQSSKNSRTINCMRITPTRLQNCNFASAQPTRPQGWSTLKRHRHAVPMACALPGYKNSKASLALEPCSLAHACENDPPATLPLHAFYFLFCMSIYFSFLRLGFAVAGANGQGFRVRGFGLRLWVLYGK